MGDIGKIVLSSDRCEVTRRSRVSGTEGRSQQAGLGRAVVVGLKETKAKRSVADARGDKQEVSETEWNEDKSKGSTASAQHQQLRKANPPQSSS